MKKVLTIAIVVLLSLSTFAQNFGVKAGYNMSGYLINFYSPEGSKMSMGFNAGVIGELPISDLLSLRTDLTFNQLGSDYDSKDETDEMWPLRAMGVEYNYKQSINYIQLGISPKLNFGPAYVYGGPYFAYAINGMQKATWTTADGEQTGTFDIFSDPNPSFDFTKEYTNDNNEGGTGDLHNKVDFGLNLGLGAVFSNVLIEANFGYGFMNFINTDSKYYSQNNYVQENDPTKPITEDATQNNIYFGFSVGYMFGN